MKRRMNKMEQTRKLMEERGTVNSGKYSNARSLMFIAKQAKKNHKRMSMKRNNRGR